MSNSPIWYLENIDLTDILCPRKQEQQPPAHLTYKAGEYINIPNDRSGHIYFLNSGKIKIGSTNAAGKEITDVMLFRGEAFGLLPSSAERRRKDFACCIADCKVSVISVDEMKSLFRDYHAISRFFLKFTGSKRLEMQDRLESLVFRDSGTRIANLLVEMGKRKGKQQAGGELLLRDAMKVQELARLSAGSGQRVVARLGEFRKENMIAFSEKNILIKDMERLEKNAQKQ